MKIINLITQNTFEYDAKKQGENHAICPECSQYRKHKNKKSFSWNETKQAGYCQNCQGKFVPFKPKRETVQYTVPEYKNKTDLSEGSLKYMNGRMISQETLIKMKVYSDNEWMPQVEKETGVICFPYFYENKQINIKFRTKEKGFKLIPGAELIFYNLDCVKNFNEIIIVEGEIDCLSFIEIGLQNCISVPNGASAKCEYLDDYIDLFEGKKIIIATDNDLPGLNLRNELIRRFGNENCSIINFKDHKDANEVLVKLGGLELKKLYDERSDLPIDGIINIDKCYDDFYSLYINGMKPGLKINDDLDELVTWESSRLAVWTGIPTHGKSEYLDEIAIRLNSLQDWKVAYFSPENYPIKYHYSKIAQKISGLGFSADKLGHEEFNQLFEYIQNNFFFIYPEDNFTLESILEKVKYLIKRNGVKNVILDPYNKFEHNRDRGETETEYISKFLDKTITFAQKNDVLINLVAHPTKMKKDSTGLKFDVPTLYDISGSAHFYNKADYGVSIYREWGNDPHTQIHVQKVKFKHLGPGGMIQKRYNYNNGRYEPYDSTVDQWSKNSLLNQIDNQPKKLDPNIEFEIDITPVKAPF